MCGEFVCLICCTEPKTGSSPHVWGILDETKTEVCHCRFIPTCVGNSVVLAVYQVLKSVHPHMCGEFSTRVHMSASVVGSSPHVWGIHCGESVEIRHPRFIPTCVGNSLHPVSIYTTYPVHPHMCGEFSLSFVIHSAMVGSSPHVWGIQQIRNVHVIKERFIPTCVGNSHGSLSVPILIMVHPHMCGEFLLFEQVYLIRSGSSPHVWGIRMLLMCCKCCLRFIPTCVGNSSVVKWPNWLAPVHPHMCGEFALMVLFLRAGDGSSPHVWGIRFVQLE